MPLTIDGQANSITSSVGGVNIPATVGTLSVGPSGSYMNVTSSGVGIGTLTPQTTLDVGGTIRNTPDKSSYIQVGRFSSAYGGAALSTAGGSTFLSLQVEGFEGLKIDSAGRVTKPYQPYFYARTGRTGGDGYTNNPYRFEDVLHNVGNNFVTSGTGAYERFVAPVAGLYCFQSAAGYKQTSVDWNMYLAINGTGYAEIARMVGSLNSHSLSSGSITVKLNANDYVTITSSGGAYHINVTFNYFCGFLVG
jgi:hypothetical protein